MRRALTILCAVVVCASLALASPTRSPSRTRTPTPSNTATRTPSSTVSPTQRPTASYSEYNPGPNWTAVWWDEFEGPNINVSNWNYDLGGGGGWGNNELEVYTNSSVNSFIQAGYLNIKAVKNTDGTYTSARMNTRDRYAFLYGKIAIRALLPYGKGIWPALWMLGTSFSTVSWPQSGEIDIMEMVGGGLSGDSSTYCTIHYDNNGYATEGSGQLLPLTNPGETFREDFHVFEVERTASSLTFRMDGNYLWTTSINVTLDPSRSEFHLPFFLIMNVAVGGNWPGNPDATTVFNQTMLVDWVRYYQWSGSGSPPPPVTPTPRPNSVIKPWRQFASWINDGTSQPSYSLVPISEAPTAETVGLRVRTLSNGINPWDTGVNWPTTLDLKTTDVLRLSFYARKISPVNATVIRAQVIFETNSAPYVRSLSYTSFLTVSTSWKLFNWTFSPVANYSPAFASVKLLLGYGPQEFEVTDVALLRDPSLTPTPLRTLSPTNTPSPIPSPSNTPTNSPSPSPSPSNTPTNTPSPSPSPSYTPTNTPSPSPSPSYTPNNTPSLSPSPSNTPTNTPSPTLSPSNLPTNTPSPTSSPSNSPTSSPALTAAPSPTQLPSQSLYLNYTEYNPGANWTAVWWDEFEGPNVDASKWNYDLGGGGWGNNELEVYTNSSVNSFIQDGYLNIKAVKNTDGTYTSARMNTRDRYAFLYGKIAIRAQLPYGKGIWPALWMLGTSFSTVGWPQCGEIDIMEIIGGGVNGDSATYSTIHYDNNGYATASSGQLLPLNPGETFHDAFHVFELEWTTTALTFRLDGNYLWAVSIDLSVYPSRSEFHQPFFLLMNVAVGGNWPGYPDASTVFPQSMLVDWVRYYQWSGPTPPPSPASPTPNPNSVIVPWTSYQSWVNDGKAQPTFTLVSVTDAPTTDNAVLRIGTLDNGLNPWDTGVHWPTIVNVQTSDMLRLSFYARKISPTTATVIRTQVLFETNSGPYVQSFAYTSFLTTSTSWQLFNWTFSPAAFYAPGAASVKFLVGYGPQEFDITAVALLRINPSLTPTPSNMPLQTSSPTPNTPTGTPSPTSTPSNTPTNTPSPSQSPSSSPTLVTVPTSSPSPSTTPTSTPRPISLIVPWRGYLTWVNENAAQPNFTLVSVNDAPTDSAVLRIRTLANGLNPWDTGVHWPTIVNVQTSDVMRVSFYARKISPTNATVIRAQVLFETNGPPYVQSFSYTSFLTASTTWSFFTWTFSPVGNYVPANVSVKLLVGYGPQEFDITDVTLVRQ